MKTQTANSLPPCCSAIHRDVRARWRSNCAARYQAERDRWVAQLAEQDARRERPARGDPLSVGGWP